MGSTPQADIIGNVQVETIPIPARASNAGNDIIPIVGKGQAAQILSAWMETYSGSQAGSATNYADVKIVNMDLTALPVAASKSFSATGASIASQGSASMALNSAASALSKTSAQRFGVSYASQGNGIALVAHSISIAYQLI